MPSFTQGSTILFGHCQDKSCNQVYSPSLTYSINSPVFGLNVMTFPIKSAQPILITFLGRSNNQYTEAFGTINCNDTNCKNPHFNATDLGIYFSQPSTLVGSIINGLPLFTLENSETLYILSCSDIACNNYQVNSFSMSGSLSSPLQLLTHPTTNMPFISYNTGSDLYTVECFDILCVNHTINTLIETQSLVHYGIIFGPDDFLYYVYYNNTHYNFIHCEDIVCDKYGQFEMVMNQYTYGTYDTIQLLKSDIIYAMINYLQQVALVPLCGPYLKQITPNTGKTHLFQL